MHDCTTSTCGSFSLQEILQQQPLSNNPYWNLCQARQQFKKLSIYFISFLLDQNNSIPHESSLKYLQCSTNSPLNIRWFVVDSSTCVVTDRNRRYCTATISPSTQRQTVGLWEIIKREGRRSRRELAPRRDCTSSLLDWSCTCRTHRCRGAAGSSRRWAAAVLPVAVVRCCWVASTCRCRRRCSRRSRRYRRIWPAAAR